MENKYQIDVKFTGWDSLFVISDLPKEEVIKLVKECNSYDDIKDNFSIEEIQRISSIDKYVTSEENEGSSTVELMKNYAEKIADNGIK